MCSGRLKTKFFVELRPQSEPIEFFSANIILHLSVVYLLRRWRLLLRVFRRLTLHFCGEKENGKIHHRSYLQMQQQPPPCVCVCVVARYKKRQRPLALAPPPSGPTRSGWRILFSPQSEACEQLMVSRPTAE